MKIKTLNSAICASILLLALSGCSAGASVGAKSEAEPLKEVSVGIFPSKTFAPLQLGIDKGIFAKHGLELSLESSQGGAATLPAVATGSIDVAIGNPVSVITAASKGLDVKIIAGYSYDGPALQDTILVAALPNSGIVTAKNLAGRNVAVNSLKGAGELGIREAVERDGGDPEAVKFTEIGFPDMAAQLLNGGVDAVMLSQPFLQDVMDAGGVIVSDFQKDAGLGGTILVTFSSGPFAAQNPAILKSFQTALAESLEYAEANPDEMRDLLPDFLGVDASTAKKIKFEGFSAKVNVEALTAYAQLMVKYGVSDTLPDVKATILK
jgi:NitT/TauT family transport system substrate-binding protein